MLFYSIFQLSPLPNVTGLRWGDYVGSPDYGDPMPVWTQTHASRVASLVALPTGEVFGLGPDNCLLVMYSKEKGKIHVVACCYNAADQV